MTNITKRVKDLVGEGIEETFDPELKRAFEFDNNKVDKKLQKTDNVKLVPNKFRVSGDSVFYTLQGEGETMGRPIVFIRLHVCNLKCVWCDSWYTWNPKTPEFWVEPVLWTIKEAKEKIEKAWADGCDNPKTQKRLVFTGGEPMLQKHQIDQLMFELSKEKEGDWVFEIETNGTIMPTSAQLQFCQFNCSPKLANSQNDIRARQKDDVIKALKESNTQFKFVVMADKDLDEIQKEWVDKYDLDINTVCLMPQGMTDDEVNKNAKRIVEYAKKKGYRLLGRLQNSIWGAVRRV